MSTNTPFPKAKEKSCSVDDDSIPVFTEKLFTGPYVSQFFYGKQGRLLEVYEKILTE